MDIQLGALFGSKLRLSFLIINITARSVFIFILMPFHASKKVPMCCCCFALVCLVLMHVAKLRQQLSKQ